MNKSLAPSLQAIDVDEGGQNHLALQQGFAIAVGGVEVAFIIEIDIRQGARSVTIRFVGSGRGIHRILGELAVIHTDGDVIGAIGTEGEAGRGSR